MNSEFLLEIKLIRKALEQIAKGITKFTEEGLTIYEHLDGPEIHN